MAHPSDKIGIACNLGTLTSDLLASLKRKAVPREGLKELAAGFKKQKDKLGPKKR